MLYFAITIKRPIVTLLLAVAGLICFLDPWTQKVVARSSTAHAATHSANSQRAHVAVLTTGESAAPDDPTIIGLRRGLNEAGYREAENLTLTISPAKTYEELSRDIRRYLRERISVFVTIGTTPVDIARSMIPTTPVVFVTRNPLGRGLIKSFNRAGTNFTGLSVEDDPNIEGKHLEIFTETVPRLRRLLVLYEGVYGRPTAIGSMDPLHKTIKRLGLVSTEVGVSSVSDIERAVSNLPKNIDFGIYAICTQFFTSDKITPSVARARRIPFYGCQAQVTKFGALLSFGPDFVSVGRRGAWYVDQILKGAKPQDMPVETPRKYELTVNLGTAKKIGLIIPPHVLQRADVIVE